MYIRVTFLYAISRKKGISIIMIAITKDEKIQINKRFPKAHIVRTMKQKSKRHRYYCEETDHVMDYLEHLRKERGIVSDT